MKEQNIVAILGGGRIAKVHIETLRKNFPTVRMKYMVDPYLTEEMTQWAKEMGVENAEKEAGIVFNDPEVDCVFICSPTPTHSDYILRCCETKKNVYCEKPLDSSVERIKMAISAVEKSGIKFFMGFMRRFDVNQRRMKEIIDSGKIGKPEIIKTCSRDPELPTYKYIETSGGLFFDSMIHDFDLARYFSNSEITEVYAVGNALVDPKVKELGDVDTAVVSVKFESGAIGICEESRRSGCGYDQRTEVHCSQGWTAMGNVPETTVEVHANDVVSQDRPVYFFLERYANAFENAQKAFFASVNEDASIPVTIYDGYKAVLVAKAAQKSLEEGRAVKICEMI
jgi:myo-inositol 2-dehydrogenase/D-chiro-inositol 1-dehydrogenase